ncbi:BTAD domain-containing putative transcriptional regulator [Kitasatospora sp. NPDC054939]
MHFEVLGPLQVRTDEGAPVAVREPKVRALLAVLLAHHGQPVAADRLVDELWGEAVPGNAANTLQTKVSQLRRSLELGEPGGRALVARRPAGYLLEVPDPAVDAGRFTELTARARRTDDPRGRARLLSDALALWRGPAFAEFRDETFAETVGARLDEQRLTALEELADIRLELGEHRLLADELGDHVRQHPLRERLRAVHLRALYRAGRQTEALDGYRELTDHLAEELGLDPGPELVALHRAILRQDPALTPAPAAATPATRATSGNLPAATTDLVGRRTEVARIGELLATGRLVTLTGPGGVGKTRLALAAAAAAVSAVSSTSAVSAPSAVSAADAAAADAFPDGVWLVELAAETAESGRDAGAGRNADRGASRGAGGVDDVAAAVAEALGIRDHAVADLPPRRAADRLAQALGPRRLLLVLDNCEHLVEPVAELAERLLRHAPDLRILATSREPLAISGELLHAVEPLPESDAVRLFAARAAAASPGFALGPANADAVARICERLDGIPLALELAAARVRALGVHELAERLGDRFRLLNAGRRDSPARQRTLRAVIDWSWELLTDPERTVLRRLSVFAGGWTLAAAEEVCAAPDVPGDTVLDVLTRLVDRSLVTMRDDPDGARYRMLESVAAYSLERLDLAGESRLARRRHAAHFTALAERAEPLLWGPEQRSWLRRLDTESANLRAALAASTGGGGTTESPDSPDTSDSADTSARADCGPAAAGDGAAGGAGALRLVNALTWYWFLRGRLDEARRAFDLALRSTTPAPAPVPAPAPSSARAGALARQAAFALLTGDGGQAQARTADDWRQEGADARARWFLELARCGFAELSRTDRTEALLAEFRAADDHWGIAATRSTLATQALYRGDLAGLRLHAVDSAARFAELGDGWGRLQAADQLGVLAEIAGDYTAAARLQQDGVRLAEELHLWTDVSFRLSRLGRIALLRGEYAAAAEHHERARRLAAEQSHRPAEQFAVIGLALGARRSGDPDTAEAHLRPWLDWNRRQGVDSGAALVLAELGFGAEQRGDADRARSWHLEGLAAARRTGDPRAVALALEGLAGAQSLYGGPTTSGGAASPGPSAGSGSTGSTADPGSAEQAARLLGTASAVRESVGSPLPQAERGDVDRITARAVEALGAAAFATAFGQGSTLAPDDHLDDLPPLPLPR